MMIKPSFLFIVFALGQSAWAMCGCNKGDSACAEDCMTKARSCILRCIPTKDSNCYLSCLESVVLPEPVLSIAPILEDGLVSKVTEHPSLPTLVDELEHLEEEKEDEESCEDDASKILDDILDVQKTASPVVSAISSVAAALEPTSISMVDIVDALFNDANANANANAKQPVEEDCDDDDEPVMIEQEEEEDCEHNVVPSVSAVSASAGLSNINIDDWMNSLVSQAVTAQQPRSTVTAHTTVTRQFMASSSGFHAATSAGNQVTAATSFFVSVVISSLLIPF